MKTKELDELWGTIVDSIALSHLEMELMIDLSWDSGGVLKKKRILFAEVQDFRLTADKIFLSEVVELIAIEATRQENLVLIKGELSNYLFELSCSSFFVTDA